MLDVGWDSGNGSDENDDQREVTIRFYLLRKDNVNNTVIKIRMPSLLSKVLEDKRKLRRGKRA